MVPPDTVIENVGNAALSRPSLTRITMPEVVPACALVGVPLSRPVRLLKKAQAGLLVMENRSQVQRSGSDALGWNK